MTAELPEQVFPIAPNVVHDRSSVSVERLVSAFFGNKSPNTVLAYKRDLVDFAHFLGLTTLDEGAQRLFAVKHSGDANLMALDYAEHLRGRNLAPKTIARRLVALRSLAKLGNMLGLVPWVISTPGPKKPMPQRDVTGPALAGVDMILAAAAKRKDAKGARDVAMVRLLFDMGLRCFEVAGLDYGHVDDIAMKLSILGKGRSGRELLTIPDETYEAVVRWLSFRGNEHGALFFGLGRGTQEGRRLTPNGLRYTVARLGKLALIEKRVTPHGLRHAAVTAALDALNGDVRRVMRFSRHQSVVTVMAYDDARHDVAGEVAQTIARPAPIEEVKS